MLISIIFWFYICLNIDAYFVKEGKKKKNVVNLRVKINFIDDKKFFSLCRKLCPVPEKRIQEA
jgi:hypothetical protein